MPDDDTSRSTADAATYPDRAAALSLDTVFELLSNRRRRFSLYALADTTDGVVALETLLEEVVSLEAATADEAFTRRQYLETATDLYHWHLPVLSDVGVIDCDERHDTIRYLNQPLLDTWVSRVRVDELDGQAASTSVPGE